MLEGRELLCEGWGPVGSLPLVGQAFQTVLIFPTFIDLPLHSAGSSRHRALLQPHFLSLPRSVPRARREGGLKYKTQGLSALTHGGTPPVLCLEGASLLPHPGPRHAESQASSTSLYFEHHYWPVSSLSGNSNQRLTLKCF